MTVGSCTLAASSAKDTEEIIQQYAHEVIGQVLSENFNIQYKDGDSDVRGVLPGGVHAAVEGHILHRLRSIFHDLHDSIINDLDRLHAY